MTFPWAILIALLVLGLAFAIKESLDIFEEQNLFFFVIGGLLVLYVGAAFLVSASIPKFEGTSDIGLFASQVFQGQSEGGL